MNNEELVKLFDPRLKLRRYLKDLGGSHVNVVEKEGYFYVLKAASSDFYKSQLEREKNGLVLAKNVSGITHLVEDYGNKDGYSCILKEFVEGVPLEYCEFNDPENLRLTFNKLHEVGISYIGLSKLDVVVSSNSLVIVDLGQHILRSDCEGAFELGRNKDEETIEFLFSH